MADQIHIRDLHLRTVIGINEEKRRDKQDVLINLVLDTDIRAAGRSDDVADTLNYRTLTRRIIELVENAQFCLVEKLAAEIARLGVQPVKWQVSARQVCAPATLG